MARTRGALRLLAVTAAVAFAAAAGGCGGDGGDPVPAEVTGVVGNVSIEGDGARFSVRTEDRSYVLHMSPEIDYGMRPPHLIVHRDTGQQVRCRVERRGDRLVALTILDA